MWSLDIGVSCGRLVVVLVVATREALTSLACVTDATAAVLEMVHFASTTVTESQIPAESCLGLIGHVPEGKQHRVTTGREETDEGHCQIGNVKMAAVVFILINKVCDKHKNVERAPTDSEVSNHGVHVRLRSFLLHDVDVFKVV